MGVLGRLAARSLARNRVRTAVSAVGIALACALVTAVLTTVVSMTAALERRTAADEGSWQVEVSEITRAGFDKLAQDDRVAHHLEVAELGCLDMGKVNAADYGRWLFLKTWPENPADEALIATPQILSGRAPAAPGEIALPNYLEGVELAPCGLAATGALGIGSEVTFDLGTRTVTNEAGSYTGTSATGSIYNPDEQSVFTQDLGQRTYTVVGFFRSWGVSATKAMSGNTALAWPEEGDIAGALDDGSEATCVFSVLDARRATDATALSDDYALDEALSGGTVLHSSLLRWQGVTGDSSLWNTLYAIAGVLAAVIVVAGVSLVYNSFAISVAERTRQFGLLASLGASRRQLRRSVVAEALMLAAVGIPVGIVLGLVGCVAIFHLTGEGLAGMLGADSYGISVSVVVAPGAIALSAALALVTVLVSAWVPAVRASRVSAVDAIRQTQDVRLTRRERRKLARTRRYRHGASPRQELRARGLAARLFGVPGLIAHRNLSRATSKGRVTVAALAVSVALLIISGSIGEVLGYASGTTLDTQGDVDLSVRVDATSAPGADGVAVRSEGDVDGAAFARALEDLLAEAGELAEGRALGSAVSYIEDIWVPATMAADGSDGAAAGALADGSIPETAEVRFVDDATWRAWIAELGLSEDEFCNPDAPRAVALNAYRRVDEEGVWTTYRPLDAPGEVYALEFADIPDHHIFGLASDADGTTAVRYLNEDGTGEIYVPLEEGVVARTPITVGALAETAPAGVSTSSDPVYILPSSAIALARDLDFYTGALYFSCDGDAAAASELEQDIDKLAADHPELDCTFDNVAQEKTQARMMASTVQTFISCFSVICGLIAVANAFNTLTNSLILRRREFAVLRSVGMGGKAFRRMVAYECASYAVRGYLIGLALAAVVTALLTQSMRTSYASYAFHLPLPEVAASAAIVAAVMLLSVIYALRRTHAASVVEALRDDEV